MFQKLHHFNDRIYIMEYDERYITTGGLTFLEKMDVRYVVLNSITFGYINTATPDYVYVLASKIGGHDWKNGRVAIGPRHDTLRAATEQDFHDFRVKVPPNFTPISDSQMTTLTDDNDGDAGSPNAMPGQ